MMMLMFFFMLLLLHPRPSSEPFSAAKSNLLIKRFRQFYVTEVKKKVFCTISSRSGIYFLTGVFFICHRFQRPANLSSFFNYAAHLPTITVAWNISPLINVKYFLLSLRFFFFFTQIAGQENEKIVFIFEINFFLLFFLAIFQILLR